MRIGILIVAAVTLLIGIVWMGQGANLIGGSFMTGHRIWLFAGVVLSVAGAAGLWWGLVGYRRIP
jgi:hypothetical protein